MLSLVRSSATIRSSLSIRLFQSRAHPKPNPEFAVGQAIERVLEEVEQRKVRRAEKWERNAPKREEKGIKVSSNIFMYSVW